MRLLERRATRGAMRRSFAEGAVYAVMVGMAEPSSRPSCEAPAIAPHRRRCARAGTCPPIDSPSRRGCCSSRLQSISTGLGQLVGSLVGGLALTLVGSYLTIFAMTSVLRFVAASIMAVVLVEVFRTAGLGRRGLLLRVVGLRPSGGVIHRPLD